MKKIGILALLCLMFASFIPEVLYAQQSPSLLVVFEEKVAPCDYPQFIKAQKETVELWKKYQIDVPVYAYQNDEYAFYWVVFLHNFASLDTLFTKFSQISAKLKKDGFDGNAKFRDLSTMSYSVMMWDPELSYHLDDSFIQTMDNRYVEWSFYYLLSGHEQEVADAVKAFARFNREKQIDYSFDTFKVLMGNETPAMIVMMRAENPLSMRTRESNFMDKYGKDFSPMWDQFAIHLRKIENKQGWFIPSFSNISGL
jgi:hypothetical protein